MISRLVLPAILMIGLAVSFGASARADGSVAVADPWARATAGKTGAAYLTIRNDGDKPDRLMKIDSSAAKASLHTTIKDGNIMRMRAVDGLDIPAHGAVTFKPEGYHIMLEGLKGPLKQGGNVPLTLTFRDAGRVDTNVPVLKAGAKGAASGGGMAGMHDMGDMKDMPGMSMPGH